MKRKREANDAVKWTRPSHIRTQPLLASPRNFSTTSWLVIAFLNKGCTLGEAARFGGTAKSRARVIRLRAARRGFLSTKALEIMQQSRVKWARDTALGKLRKTRS